MSKKEIVTLKNIEVLGKAILEVVSSPKHLPKMVTFSGPSGFGKSFAAAYVMNKYDCAYVEIGASWGVSHTLDNILKELGTATKERTIAKKMEVVIDSLILANKPLILDEFDYCTKPRALEVVREMHDKAGVPIILIGEELLPKKLEEVERFHNRVLKWVKAEAVSMEDAEQLAKLYAPQVNIKQDLLEKIVNLSQGRVRRVCVNLEQIKNESTLNGWSEVDVSTWGTKQLFTGKAPVPRRI